jgi:hypothetical protein
MKIHKFHGKIIKGIFESESPESYKIISGILEGKKVYMTLSEWKPYEQRSCNQNSYFHGIVCDILSEYTGYTPSEMKAVMKYQFNVKHTSALSTSEFEDFMRKIREWAAKQWGLYIPSPNEIPIQYYNK